jgi:hypothetical protein
MFMIVLLQELRAGMQIYVQGGDSENMVSGQTVSLIQATALYVHGSSESLLDECTLIALDAPSSPDWHATHLSYFW